LSAAAGLRRPTDCTDVWVYPSGLVQTVEDRDALLGDDDSYGENGQRMVLVGCRFTQPIGSGTNSS